MIGLFDTAPTTPTAPTFIAYHVQDTASGQSSRRRIGAAWQHADGKGMTLEVDIFPLDGRIVLHRSLEGE